MTSRITTRRTKNVLQNNTEATLTDTERKTERRLLEIKFFTMFEPFILALDDKPHLMSDFYDIFAEMFELKNPQILRTAHSIFKEKALRPTKYEKVIMARYEGLSYRKIQQLFGTTDQTIGNYLHRFIIEQEGSLPLSTIRPSDFNELQDTIKHLRITIKPLALLLLLLDKKEKTEANREE